MSVRLCLILIVLFASYGGTRAEEIKEEGGNSMPSSLKRVIGVMQEGESIKMN